MCLELARELRELLRWLLCHRNHHDNVTGGFISQGDTPMVTITPGNTPKFQVTPAFSGAAFTLEAAQASITSSDPVNFPVELDPTDTTGTMFEAPIPTGATIPTGGEAVTVTWTYTNLDGTVATVSATLTEQGLTDDVTGGTVAQLS